MASIENGLPATERTALLEVMPSAHSTNDPVHGTSYSSNGSLPLASSFDDLRESAELEMQTLIDQAKKRDPYKLPRNDILRRRHAILILFFGCTSCVMLIVLFIFQLTAPSGIYNPLPETPTALDFQPLPFSAYDPVRDLGLMEFVRPDASSPPSTLFQRNMKSKERSALPTNAWYQNMLLVRGEPSNLHRAYAVPYLLDAVGVIPGLQVIAPNRVLAGANVMQLYVEEMKGLTLGATNDLQENAENDSHKYTVLETTELGLTLHWNAMKMTSPIVRGMAYATMEYGDKTAVSSNGSQLYPTIASPISLGKPPIVDGHFELLCSSTSNRKPKKVLVQNEIELYFEESDYSWLVFFSEAVWVQCVSGRDNDHTYLQVIGYNSDDCDGPLIIRAALLDSCTKSPTCSEDSRFPEISQRKGYARTVRKHASNYPGRHTSIAYKMDDDSNDAEIVFDWDATSMTAACNKTSEPSLRRFEEGDPMTLLTYALPHHMDTLNSSVLPENSLYCISSITGPACLVEGSTWSILENLPRIAFQAPRPPRPHFLPALTQVLLSDINYTLPDFFQRGAGDTYFSGKMLAKLGRILLIAEEVEELCHGNKGGRQHSEYVDFCLNSTLPSAEQLSSAVDRLRSGVEIWINGTADTPFVYDVAWGGVVSCGCQFNEDGCDNRAPDCPAFFDHGLNFGNAFYNDQHYHYGYHIYSAAVVAHFDPEWGKKHYEQVLLLVRNIANPSRHDQAFPLYRHKDWYQGSSWASGVPLPVYLNGKNQESSSEAIAAYEAVALYGQVMSDIWKSVGNNKKAAASNEVRKVGQLMTATELRSTKKYWHVMRHDKSKAVYPEIYDKNVVGILWSTMIQFGTWFGGAPYLPYGIQLLPLTPISEERDDIAWANEMYYPFSKACAANFDCTESGWVSLQLAILATVGYPDEAAKRVGALPDDSFENAGGNGHSKSNTIWYIATRPVVEDPVPIDESDARGSDEKKPAPVFVLKDCYTPKTCTDEVLDRKAGEYSCRERISWVINAMGKSQWQACFTVSAVDYPNVCGPCDPSLTAEKDQSSIVDEYNDSNEIENDSMQQCPPCTEEECNSDLNYCPVFDRTFVCTQGASKGGCSGQAWTNKAQCDGCCELTSCQKKRDQESAKITNDIKASERAKCPPCSPAVCYGELNLCPIHTAPFLCTQGSSVGGCATKPWHVSEESPCSECCEVTITC